MNNKRQNAKNFERTMQIHLLILVVATVGGIGLMAASLSLEWEFWIAPLAFVGIVIAWGLHVFQFKDLSFREKYYVFFVLVCDFLHGMHPTSFFDVSLLTMLILITFSLLESRVLLDYVILQYMLIMVAQFYMEYQLNSLSYDSLVISRLVLHFSAAFLVFFLCIRMMEARKSSRDSLKMLQEEADSAYESIEDFLTNISHELRTPINAVIGVSSMMEKDIHDPRLAHIEKAGERLAQQVNDILDYTELKKGSLVLNPESYDVPSLINDIVNSNYPEIKSKRLDFVVDVAPDVPRVMYGDSRKIGMIIHHLISNAIKFTHVGGIYLGLSAVERSYGVNLSIKVADTGQGMDRNTIGELSKGLYQADKSRIRSTGGVGLGMAIVYGFAHGMEGFVHVDSQVNHGSTVTVTIPQGVVEAENCLEVKNKSGKFIASYIRPEKYATQRLTEFYERSVTNLMLGIRVPVQPVFSLEELKSLLLERRVTHIVTGDQEYEEAREFFQSQSTERFVTVTRMGCKTFTKEGHILFIPKPVYSLNVARMLNMSAGDCWQMDEEEEKLDLTGYSALIVDDEPMNLMVAKGLFKGYGLEIDTVGSGMEAIKVCANRDYDFIYMDHMMPEMDGVETARRIWKLAESRDRRPKIIALTANAVSGARDMFRAEGFDGFIAKPIDIAEFEHTMRKLLG